VTLSVETRNALRARRAESNLVSEAFDFMQEGDAAATFWRQATPGTTYWRGFIPMLLLGGQVLPIGEDSLALDGEGPGASLVLKGHKGAAIWQFLGDDGRSRIALQIRRQGARTLLEADDNYLRFAPPLYGNAGAWTRTHAEAIANGTGYSVEMHRKVVPQMDGVICSTQVLAEEYAEYNPTVYVCPNSIFTDDWEGYERVESDVLRIGYYGSPSHVRDWPRVKKALKWAARQKDVEVVLAGFQPPGFNGRVLPWHDNLFDARRHLFQIDVGIAPLTQNPWANGKSDLKALEYAMGGAMPIVEDAPPFSPWKAAGWPFMPGTPDEWDDVIRDLVVNRDRVPGHAQRAKDYVLAERTIESNIHCWEEAIRG